MYRIGVDAGSKTVKLVILDEEGHLACSVYQRHRSDIVSTLTSVIDEVMWRMGDVDGSVAFTGSAGIGIAEAAGIPFVQEVMATTRSVQERHPQADVVIELGGEDAKVVYLTGGLEQRMNATCAGGTGGFIDMIAFMLGVSAKDMSDLGMSAQHEHPIASRCAVFAQSDVRPLLNAGVRKADIAGSVLEAVVRQTLTGLACGREIKGTVVFAGGPLEHIPDLVSRFRRALGLTRETGIKPRNAHLIAADGAALLSASCEPAASNASLQGPAAPAARTFKLSELRDAIARSAVGSDLPRLRPLFSTPEDRASFDERHAGCKIPTVRLFDCQGSLYLGIDAGSTAVKLAVIDEGERLAYSDYRQVRGDVLGTTVKMLADFYRALPTDYRGRPLCKLAHVTATGYGEALLRAGLGADSGVVETLAHVKAALKLEPELSFLLDIGGQDMKALWVRDGVVEEAVLNEACSSGCGSFIEGTAHALRVPLEDFGELALTSPSPLDLGTRCTVFMTSRVRHAQKIGASLEDIAGGIAYSVVRNALFRTIGADGVAKIGDKVVVQGGAFASDAVLRAFELVSGAQALRPDKARLMGAIGAALVAKGRFGQLDRSNGETRLLGPDELRSFSYTKSARPCGRCSNNCMLSEVSFAAGGSFITGNRCSRPEAWCVAAPREAGGGAKASGDARQCTARSVKPPNVMALRQGLLKAYSRNIQPGRRGEVRIGLITALHAYDKLPFWHTMLTHLGFSVLTPEGEGFASAVGCDGMEQTPSESVCYSAKISHAKLSVLRAAGVQWAFMPSFERGRRCPVSCGYPMVLEQTISQNGYPASEIGFLNPHLVEPSTASLNLSSESREALLRELNKACPDELSPEELDCALDAAYHAQREYERTIERGNELALAWMRKRGARGLLLVGRPYHADPALSHSIDRVAQGLGLAVLSPPALQPEAGKARNAAGEWHVSSKMETLTKAAFENPLLDVVVLQSFGCSYDAVSTTELRATMAKWGKAPVVLKLDDVVDTAHVGIRLRTLVETVELRQDTNQPDLFAAHRDDGPEGRLQHRRQRLSSLERTQYGNPHAFLEITHDDVEAARVHAKDLCYVAAILAGRAVRLVQLDGDLSALAVPMVCQKCVLDMLPRVVSRACGREIEVSWVTEVKDLRELYAPKHIASPAKQKIDRPPIGIVGTLPLCFDTYLNDGVIAFLESQGCRVVLPDPANLVLDDVRYMEQLKAFDEAGVRDVVYLQSFGCLKGHVCSRGAYRKLQRLFPDMRITFIDYDAETSALNRENRLRLAVEQAKLRAAGLHRFI